MSQLSATCDGVTLYLKASSFTSIITFRLFSSPSGLNCELYLLSPMFLSSSGLSWNLPVTRPCASGEYAMIEIPSFFARSITPFDSILRSRRLYLTWFEASGIPALLSVSQECFISFAEKLLTPMHLISFLLNISAMTFISLFSLEKLHGWWTWYRSIGYGANALIRSSMVLRIFEAKRNIGHHFVAIITSPGFFPAACRPFERAFSEAPLPYISAVSNQLIPPSREREMTLLMRSSSSDGQYFPAMFFCLLNCQQPSPIGVTMIPVRPKWLKLFIFPI